MEWFVYYYDFNHKMIKSYNVLGNSDIRSFIKEVRESCKHSKEDFSEKLRTELMYRYWSKSEWEVVVSAQCGGDGSEAIKIDAYDQIKLNWTQFVDYCWNYNFLRR